MSSPTTNGVVNGQKTMENGSMSSSRASRLISILRVLWQKHGLDGITMLKVFKSSISPVIAIAMFQSTTVANKFLLDGYIMALIAFVMPMQPLARSVRSTLLCAFAFCLGAALDLFAIWTSLQARRNTTDPRSPPAKYNSSQAAVMGVWLFFSIYIAYSVKSARPSISIPVIFFALYTVASLAPGVAIETMSQAITSEVRLLECFLVGIAIPTCVNLVILPQTCRGVFFDSITGYLTSVNNVISAQNSYFDMIEKHDPFHPLDVVKTRSEHDAHEKALNGLYGVAARLRGEQEWAQREVAVGKLSSSDISELTPLLLRPMPALSGLGWKVNALDKLSRQGAWANASAEEEKIFQQWHDMMHTLREPVGRLRHAIHQAIEHILLILELKKHPKPSGDFDSKSLPGTPQFISWYDKETKEFTKTRETLARVWYEHAGLAFPTEADFSSDRKYPQSFDANGDASPVDRRLFTVIYIQFLLYAMSREIYEIVVYVDSKVADGTLSRRRIIWPHSIHFKKLMTSLFKEEDASSSPESSAETLNSIQPIKQKRKERLRRDPEHLPPKNLYEKAGNYVRKFPKFMKSHHSIHGVRVACAVMTVAIGFYIRTSSHWYNWNRVLWALFAIVLTMNLSAGQSLHLFICRLLGTAIALAVSFAVYYMVVGIPAGVISISWIYFLAVGYLAAKFPFYTQVFTVSGMAVIVMVGNELQDKKLGFARVESLGQSAHEEYLLAPSRLAVVAIGLAVAYFWTIFPYPLSEHTELRQDLASTIYFLSSYYSMISQTVTARARGQETLSNRNKNRLAKARTKTFAKLQFLFVRLRTHITFTKWQFIIGGRFPKAQYVELIGLCEEICTATAVMGYASVSFMRAMKGAENDGQGPNKWLAEFQKLMYALDTINSEVTSSLVMLSNHMASGTPFPPFVKAPDEFMLVKVMEDVDKNMLAITHLMEPGYAGFVTMSMAGRGIKRAIKRMIEISQELLGVLDFSSFVDAESQKDQSGMVEEEETRF